MKRHWQTITISALVLAGTVLAFWSGDPFDDSTRLLPTLMLGTAGLWLFVGSFRRSS